MTRRVVIVAGDHAGDVWEIDERETFAVRDKPTKQPVVGYGAALVPDLGSYTTYQIHEVQHPADLTRSWFVALPYGDVREPGFVAFAFAMDRIRTVAK